MLIIKRDLTCKPRKFYIYDTATGRDFTKNDVRRYWFSWNGAAMYALTSGAGPVMLDWKRTAPRREPAPHEDAALSYLKMLERPYAEPVRELPRAKGQSSATRTSYLTAKGRP